MFLGLKSALKTQRTSSAKPSGPFFYIRTSGQGFYLRPGTTDKYIRP